MSLTNTARIAAGVVCATLLACSEPTAPAPAINGTYVLESVSGRGPATGTLILTHQGYAERRVRFAERNGALSPEYLARGTAAVRSDNSIDLQLREMNGALKDHVWTPATRIVDGQIELRHPDPADGPDIVERYRRQ